LQSRSGGYSGADALVRRTVPGFGRREQVEQQTLQRSDGQAALRLNYGSSSGSDGGQTSKLGEEWPLSTKRLRTRLIPAPGRGYGAVTRVEPVWGHGGPMAGRQHRGAAAGRVRSELAAIAIAQTVKRSWSGRGAEREVREVREVRGEVRA
jgi:hypothetical protein